MVTPLEQSRNGRSSVLDMLLDEQAREGMYGPGVLDSDPGRDPKPARVATRGQQDRTELVVPGDPDFARTPKRIDARRPGRLTPEQRARAEQQAQEQATRKQLEFERARRTAREQLATERRPVDADRKARLREAFLSRSQVAQIPPLEPLVDGWLYGASLAQMFGPSGGYKTFVALDMASCVALGRQWFGHEVKQGRVCYIVAEGVRGFEKRLAAVEQTRERGRIPDDALVVVRRAVQIGGPEWPEFVEIVAEEGFSLVVVDTQARATVGRQENDNSDMGEAIAALDWLIEATGCAVLLIHHSGKGDGKDDRGATSVKGALQTQIRVSKRPGLIVEMTATKQKDEEELGPIYLQMVEAADSLSVANVSDSRDVRPKAAETRDLRRLLDVTELAAMEHAPAIIRVMAATYGGGMGATKAEVKRTYTELMKDSDRPVVHSSFEKAWTKVENSGHLLKNPNEKRFVVGAEGCKAIGVPFERPAFVDEDEFEEEYGDTGDTTDFDE